MSGELTFQPIALSDKDELDVDPGRSFVITRRNGDRYTVWVSVADYDRVMAAGPWFVPVSRGLPTYPIRNKRLSNGRRVCEYLHVFIAGSGQQDHVNLNRLDNRRSNLRPATPSQNMQNRKKRSDNTSGYKGVVLHKLSMRWRARIRVGGRRISLGVFNTPEEAYAAYRAAAIKYHGSFAHF